jgi:hypothetical protein
MGLDICQTRKTRGDGTTYYSPTVCYSGFWSQGDGACFGGTYSYKKGSVKAIKEYAPQDGELHRIALALQQAQAANFYRVTARIKLSGHYYHSGCMGIELENSENSYQEIINEDDFYQAFVDLADWIYNKLEEEYKYRTSDEACIESIKCNEYEFTEDGGVV